MDYLSIVFQVYWYLSETITQQRWISSTELEERRAAVVWLLHQRATVIDESDCDS